MPALLSFSTKQGGQLLSALLNDKKRQRENGS
jgi:hypothetical protein